MNPIIFDNRLEIFFRKHKNINKDTELTEDQNKILQEMKKITNIKKPAILLKFIFNSYNVVSLLSLLEEDSFTINMNDQNTRDAYTLVQMFFSIQPFSVINTEDATSSGNTRYKRHANHLLYYFGPWGATYENYGIPLTDRQGYETDKKYEFEVYPSENKDIDVAFLLAHNGTNTLQQLNEARYRKSPFEDVEVDIPDTNIVAGEFSYSSAPEEKKQLFDLLSPGQKILVSFDKNITHKDGEIAKDTQVYIKRTTAQQTFQVIKTTGEDFDFTAHIDPVSVTKMRCKAETKAKAK